MRLGILMDQLDCEPWLFGLINELARDTNIEIFLLQNNLNQEGKISFFEKMDDSIKNYGISRFVSNSFFSLITSLEREMLKLVSRGQSFESSKKKLDPTLFAGSILLTPVFSKKKVSVTYNSADISKIKEMNLDIILRGNGRGIFKGDILRASKHGIISFHHGDNRWNRGGPFGFWEVYQRKPATGFIIQILNERLDDGDVIFRGEVPTRIHYTQNSTNILNAGCIFMEQIIKGYAATGVLPQPLPKIPFSNKLLKTPSISETLTYVFMTGLLVPPAIKRKILRQKKRWSVAYVKSDWKIANLSKGNVIKNPQGRFFADPFVVIRDNQTIIFVEDFHYSSGRGTISAIKILPDRSYEILPDIIKEEYHLSFPYIFEYENDLYMIPESQQGKAIRLYKCVQFPGCWKYVHDIMKDVEAFDSMMFEHSGLWWLLTSIASKEACGDVQLYVFSANNPLSNDWQPHPKNPVCSSVEIGRNGGLLRDREGGIYRVRQKRSFNQYGSMASIAKITKLDKESYEETIYCEVEPTFFPKIIGTHHMYSDGGITVYDFVKEETIKHT